MPFFCDDGTPMPTDPRKWLALPKLPVRRIDDAADVGEVYTVTGAGCIDPPGMEYRELVLSLTGFELAEFLPSVAVREGKQSRIYRLPPSLGGWALFHIGLAIGGKRVFPCEVEFSVLNGRPYARLLTGEAAGPFAPRRAERLQGTAATKPSRDARI